MARLDEALTDASDRQHRTNLGLRCWTVMDRVWSRRKPVTPRLARARSLLS
jgi:hypothetical protein